jgi:hypothetical protein
MAYGLDEEPWEHSVKRVNLRLLTAGRFPRSAGLLHRFGRKESRRQFFCQTQQDGLLNTLELNRLKAEQTKREPIRQRLDVLANLVRNKNLADARDCAEIRDCLNELNQ